MIWRLQSKFISRAIRSSGFSLAIVATLFASANRDARAQDAFYKDKSLNLVIGFAAGGGYDFFGRLLARLLPRHLPDLKSVSARNMAGAGGLLAANHLFNLSPRDGSEIGLIAGDLTVDPIIGGTPTQFDARRFTLLGSPNSDVGVCVARADTAFKTIEDVRRGEIVTGTTASGSLTWPLTLNATLGTQFKMVRGYGGSAAMELALERKEVEAVCNFAQSMRSAHPHWFADHLVNVLVRIGVKPSAVFPEAPLAYDLATTDAQRQLFQLLFGPLSLPRLFVAPPDIPAARAEALRAAVAATFADPDFAAEAARLGFDVAPTTPTEIRAFLDGVYQTPVEVSREAFRILERGK